MSILFLNRIEQIFQLNSADVLVLTSSNSLAYELRQQLVKKQKEMQKNVFELPYILGYERGLAYLYDQSILSLADEDVKSVLDDFSVQYLWRRTIKQMASDLLDLQGTATAAKNAHYLQERWFIHVDPVEMTEEYQHFCEWKKDYLKKLEQHGCLDQVGLIRHLIALLRAKKLRPPKHIVLYGMQSFNRLDEMFFEALSEQGVLVHHIELPLKDLDNLVLRRYESFEQELNAVLEQVVDEHAKDPSARFLVLTPDLNHHLFAIHRSVHSILGDRYHCSVGQDLSDWPLVQHILKVLEFLATMSIHKSVPKSLLGEAILAAKVCHIGDMGLGDWLALDNRVRQSYQVQYVYEDLLDWLQTHQTSQYAQWQSVLETWQTPKQALSDWIELIYQTLQMLGFPHPRYKDSYSHQVFRAFYEAIDKFSQLGMIVPNDSALVFLNLFEQYLSSLPSQVQRSDDTFLFFSELSNIPEGNWKTVWLLGLDDQSLPLSATVNHLLPVVSQQKAGVPQLDLDQELKRSEQVLQHVYHIADRVHLSYHALDSKNNELRPTPMVPEVVLATVSENPSIAKDAYVLTFEEPLYLKDLQGDRILDKSGYRLLEIQAVSPLEGFARYHLDLSPMLSYEKKALSLIRGNFTHAVMQSIWETLKTRPALDALSDQAIRELVANIADKEAWVFKGYVTDEMREYEVKRAIDLAVQSLQNDRETGEFSEVRCEQRLTWAYSNVNLKLRVDRMDMFENGKMEIYDYKTSKTLSSDLYTWDKDSVKKISFQLPLYAVVLGDKVRGFAYYHLYVKAFKEGKIKIGLQENEQGELVKLTAKKSEAEPMSMQAFRQWYERYFQVLMTRFSQYYVSNPIVEDSELQAFLRQGEEE